MSNKGFKINREPVDALFPKQDINILGYESPIEVVMGQMRIEQENNIYKAIQDYGVSVDKDELIKALKYDRYQYERGYINGYNRKASEVAREIIADIEKILEVDKYGEAKLDVRELYNIEKKYTEGEG